MNRLIGMASAAICFTLGLTAIAQPFAPRDPTPTEPPAKPPVLLTLPPANQPVRPAAPIAIPQTLEASSLVWDADSKDYNAKEDEKTANFTFNLTNVSSSEVIIAEVRTSCGCTLAETPPKPWHLPPGTNGAIKVSVNLAGKFGTIFKTVTVSGNAGVKTLSVKINIPTPTPQQQARTDVAVNRSQNMRAAMSDRQAVFKNDCTTCHFQPTIGKMGKELYQAGCAICHDAEHRATMVPDLHAPKQPPTPEYWTHWVTEGKIGSLMPAFTHEHGGPLSKEQIASLVHYLSTDFPITNSAPVAVPTPAKAGS